MALIFGFGGDKISKSIVSADALKDIFSTIRAIFKIMISPDHVSYLKNQMLLNKITDVFLVN